MPYLETEEPRRRSANRVREVYFVRAMSMGLIKIGTANHALFRLPSLQTGSPDKLELLGVLVCPNYGSLEGMLHYHFAHLRSHGEWYRPAESLLAFIAKYALNSRDAGVLRIELETDPEARGPEYPEIWPKTKYQPSPSAERSLELALKLTAKAKAKKPKKHRRVPGAPPMRGRTMAEKIASYKAARGMA